MLSMYRYDKARWEEWNRNLRLIASKAGNTIAANNVYDAEYLKYFTDIGILTLFTHFVFFGALPYDTSHFCRPTAPIIDLI